MQLPISSRGVLPTVAIAGLVIAFQLLAPLAASAQDMSRYMVFDVPPEKFQKQFGEAPGSMLTYKDRLEIASSQFDADTMKILAILVEWSDRPATFSPATMDSLLFSDGVFPGGSVADYFKEISYGQVTIVGDVYGWHDAGTYTNTFSFWALLGALDPFIDYSQYDGDDNGHVDAVIFVRSGNGEEDSQDPNDIWSYASVGPLGSGEGPFDGMLINRWNTSPETRPERHPDIPMVFTGLDILNWIRVFCHELGHNFGLPDLYDYDAKLTMSTYDTPADSNDHPMVDWCLMGYYGYGYMSVGSINPSHLCGWSKMQLGWIEPTVHYPTFSGQQLVLNDIETHQTDALYKIPIDNAQGEYFLLEYRNPHSTAVFDKTDSDFSLLFWPDVWGGWDTLDHGLLITHVHDSLVETWPINDGTPSLPHYSVRVVDAGYDPANDVWTNPLGTPTDTAQWWYPWETRKSAPFSSAVAGQEILSPATTPNSDGYSGPTGFTIQVDSIVGDQLFVYVLGNDPGTPILIAYLASDPLCQFNAPPGGSAVTTLTVNNYGTITLEADITVTEGAGWLFVAGGPSISVAAGGPPEVLPVTMDATGLAEGVYVGKIRIDHNDATQASPKILTVKFRVDADYACSDTVTLRTAVASPGVLGLTVESAGRHGVSTYQGLFRPTDSSWSLFDGSLIVAHGLQGPDTLTYFNIYGNSPDPGHHGFITSEPLTVDTGAYSTGTGNATATYAMQTQDEALSVDVDWYFPQNPDSAEFVLVRYQLENTSLAPVSNILVGQLIDFDVTPGRLFTSYQYQVNNHGHYVPEENLIYQFGYTIPGMPTTPPLGLAERYSAGVAYLSGRDYAGTGLPFQDTQVSLCGGTDGLREFQPRFFDGTASGYLYEKFAGPASVTIWEGFPHPDSSSDLFTYMCLDQGLSLAPGQTQTYVLAFVSDTLSHPDMPVEKSEASSDLVSAVQKASAWANNHGVYSTCDCPHQADLNADGFVDSIDLSVQIDIVFFGATDPQDPGCPSTRGDFNSDGFADSVDLSEVIDHVFFGGPPPVDPCAP